MIVIILPFALFDYPDCQSDFLFCSNFQYVIVV